VVFSFKTQEKYLEVYEYLLRAMISFYYCDDKMTIEINDPDKSLIKKIMLICGECNDADALLAKEMMQENVAR